MGSFTVPPLPSNTEGGVGTGIIEWMDTSGCSVVSTGSSESCSRWRIYPFNKIVLNTNLFSVLEPEDITGNMVCTVKKLRA